MLQYPASLGKGESHTCVTATRALSPNRDSVPGRALFSPLPASVQVATNTRTALWWASISEHFRALTRARTPRWVSRRTGEHLSWLPVNYSSVRGVLASP